MKQNKEISIGRLPSGSKNCITDVAGVKVGHCTLHEPLEQQSSFACTGVTAILPHPGNLFQEKVKAASYVINGFGKTLGLVQVEELGVIESPIMLTNTFAVPAVAQGTLEYMLHQNKDIGDTTGTINVVVGECNDSYLNSIRDFPVKPHHALEAIENASEKESEEGAVGAGTGMVCFGYKGGIGTSSRLVAVEDGKHTYTIGCLVLSNFGEKVDFPFEKYLPGERNRAVSEKPEDGSIIIVIATDAPVSDRQLRRISKRAGIGLSRTGSNFGHGSGDIVIAFSTAHKIPHYSSKDLQVHEYIRDDRIIMNEFFAATAEVVEEAIIQSLLQSKTTSGRNGRKVHGILDHMQ